MRTTKALRVLAGLLVVPAILWAPPWAFALAISGAYPWWFAAVLEKRATLAQAGRTAPPMTRGDGHPGASLPASPEAVDAFIRRISAASDGPVYVRRDQWVAPNDLRRES